MPLFIKKIYRVSKLLLVALLSFGRSMRVTYVDPADIQFGQKPESQFPAKSTYRFTRGGDWDQRLLPVEEHLLYKAYVDRFIRNKPWESTLFYEVAASGIESGTPFRGEYSDLSALKQRFNRCENLYYQIEANGYKSNRELYREGKVENILFLLDEVTVNISRNGDMILNDGWHRFVSARLIGLSRIPVRVLVRHSDSGEG